MRYKKRLGLRTASARVFAARGPSDGFTLVELVLVAALIGTLSMIIVPRLFGHAERVRETQALVDIREMDADIGQYVTDNNLPPPSLNEVGYGSLVDPWGRPYEHLNIIGGGVGNPRKDHFLVPVNSDYDLYSRGPDGRTGAPFTDSKARDDIVRASNGSWIGPVYEF